MLARAGGTRSDNRLRFARTPAPAPSGSRLVTESRYDDVGNLIALIDANGQVTKYLYDQRDSLQEVWESPNTWTNPATTPSPKYVTAYQYDHMGNLTRVIRAQGDSTYERAVDYAYDRLNRLINVDYSDSGTPDVSYTYDAHGQRLTMADGTGTTTYSYDELGRLLSVTTPASPSNKTVDYRYDRDGSRTKLP